MHRLSRTCAGALAALFALPVLAAHEAPAPTVVTPQSPPSALPAGAPADMLDNARGGTDIASDTRVQGSVNGNAANNVSTGANVIQSGSFANSAGIPVVIQNSGANVLIQNATVINLQFK